MTRRACLLLLAGIAPSLGGCSFAPPHVSGSLSQTQRDALETRDIEATVDRAFEAAQHALLDSGYTIVVSDPEGGLLTGMLRQDPSVAEHTQVLILSTLLTLGQAPTVASPHARAMCLIVWPRPGGASVRVRPFFDNRSTDEPERIDEIWVLMQREVLLRPVDGAPSPNVAPPISPAAPIPPARDQGERGIDITGPAPGSGGS